MSLSRVLWATALVLTAIIVCLHVAFFLSAGNPWRDEINSIGLASIPSMRDAVYTLRLDSFPPLMMLTLRAWLGVVPGASATGVRVFGLAVGVGLLGTLWWAIKHSGHRAPLLSLALFGLSPLALRSVDSIRPYGLGTLLIVLAQILVFELVAAPRRWLIVAAMVSAVLAVQCLYQNAFLLMAACVAGFIVTMRHRRTRAAVSILAVGGVAAVSLLFDLPTIRAARSWGVLLEQRVDLTAILRVLSEALGQGGVPAWSGWIVATTALTGMALGSSLRVRRPAFREPHQDLLLFHAIVTIVGTVAFVAFLLVAHIPPGTWYFVPWMGMTAVSLDCMGAALAGTTLRKKILIVLVVVVAATSIVPAWKAVRLRQTNVDAIASFLHEHAADDDWIVVSPWFFGVSFRRYFTGRPAWTTLPPIADLRIHRFDLLKEQMAASGAIDSVLDETAVRLKRGNKIWLVGRAQFLPPGHSVPNLPPAPRGPMGWYCGPYLDAWWVQWSSFIQAHALSGERVQIPLSDPVHPNEDAELVVFQGWH